MSTMQKSLFVIAIAAGLALPTAALADAGRDVAAGDTHAARGGSGSNAYIGEDSGSFHLSRQPWTSTRTRAEVVAELKVAQQRGEVAAMHCEDSGSGHLASNGQTGAAALVSAGPNVATERTNDTDGSPQVVNR
jgi:hypothetical protein